MRKAIAFGVACGLGLLLWFVALYLVINLWVGVPAARGQAPACALPAVQFLGEGPGAYAAPAGYSQLIVKQFSPFRFELLSAQTYTSTRRAAPPERVWACEGNCVLPAVYHDVVGFGYQPAGARFDVVVIDDDEDNRLNYWAVDDPAVPVAWLSAQGLTQSATYTTPIAGNWYLYAADSIGLVQPCVNPPDATPVGTPPDAPQPPTGSPTASATATLVDSSTLTPTSTPSPVETATEAATPPPDETIVDDPFTATPTNTPGAVLTLTPTPSATDSPAEQPTPTATPVVVTPPPTATQAPTGLGEGPEPGVMLKVFLPTVHK